MEYFSTDAANHKAGVQKLDFIAALLRTKFKNGVFVKMERRYAEHFIEYSNYFGRALDIIEVRVWSTTNSEEVICR